MYTMDKCQFCVKTAFVILIIFFLQTLVTGDVYDDDDDESGSWNRCPWIRNKLKNGRVKIRSRGRIAKFLCEPGYELAGKRFATCVRGQWNNPIPVCVSRGCHRPPHVDNGRVTMMYRGAVLMYDCLPGYTLEGGASIYCDGRRWSAEPPTCTVSTTDPQMSCDFEDPDLCGWSHDPTHDFDWKRNQFSTPSGHAGTGPSFDHTFGEGKGGFYLYMEASAPRSVNDTARLFSPVYPPEYSGGCFIFWYHMFGSTTGGLRVYVKPESQVFGELPAAWVTFGDQGNQWFRGNISIPHFSERFQVLEEPAIIGDTAIDDVSVRTVDCDNVGNSTDNDTSVIMADSCRGRCRESDNSPSCGCNDDCVLSSTCCDDFSSICTKGEGDESKEEIPVDRPLFGTTIRLETENVDLITSETPRQDSTDSISISPTLPPISVSSPISTSFNPKESEISVDIPVVITTPSSEVQSSNPTTKISGATTSISSTSSTISLISSTSSSTSSTPETTTTSTTTTTPTPPPAPSTSTTSSATTSTTSTTTTSTTPSTTTTSTTSSTTTTSTTVKTTLPITSSSMSTLSSSSSSSSSKPVIIPIEASSTLPRVTTTPTTPVTTTTPEPQTESTQSTRKTYNLRPRFRTTPITTSSPRSISALTTQAYQSTRIHETSRVFPPTIRTSTKTHVTTSRSVFRPPSTPIRVFTEPPSIYIGTRKNFTSSKPIIKPSEISILDTEAHASKASSDNGQPVIAIISIIIVIIICLAAGLVFFMRRLKAKKLSKLEDDSEMKFLSENEVVEYSDSSALDRINFNP